MLTQSDRVKPSQSMKGALTAHSRNVNCFGGSLLELIFAAGIVSLCAIGGLRYRDILKAGELRQSASELKGFLDSAALISSATQQPVNVFISHAEEDTGEDAVSEQSAFVAELVSTKFVSTKHALQENLYETDQDTTASLFPHLPPPLPIKPSLRPTIDAGGFADTQSTIRFFGTGVASPGRITLEDERGRICEVVQPLRGSRRLQCSF